MVFQVITDVVRIPSKLLLSFRLPTSFLLLWLWCVFPILAFAWFCQVMIAFVLLSQMILDFESSSTQFLRLNCFPSHSGCCSAQDSIATLWFPTHFCGGLVFQTLSCSFLDFQRHSCHYSVLPSHSCFWFCPQTYATAVWLPSLDFFGPCFAPELGQHALHAPELLPVEVGVAPLDVDPLGEGPGRLKKAMGQRSSPKPTFPQTNMEAPRTPLEDLVPFAEAFWELPC